MKKSLYALILMALGSISGHADEPATLSKNPHPDISTQDYAGKLGVGIILGEPTGGSVKYWLNDTMALDPGPHADLHRRRRPVPHSR